MLDNITIGKYYNVKSDIHALNSLAKLFCLLMLVISLLVTKDINIILIILTFELIILFITNIPLKTTLKNLLSLKYLFIFIILINIITGNDLIWILKFILKILGITIYSNMFVLTTTSKQILDSLNQFLSPLKIFGIKIESISLIISLAIQFIPITIEEANRILKSLKIRGLSKDSSINSKLIGLKSLIIPLYISSIRRADKLADLMELRFFDLDFKKTLKKNKWNYLDILFIIIHVIILLIVLKEVVL